MNLWAARADFPAQRIEELNQLLGARDSTAKHLSEIRMEKESALAQLSQAESQRRELAAYAPFAGGTDAGKYHGMVCELSRHLSAEGWPAKKSESFEG